MYRAFKKTAIASTLLSGLVFSAAHPAQAQEAPLSADPQKKLELNSLIQSLEQQRSLLENQEKQLDSEIRKLQLQQKSLREQREEFRRLRARVDELTGDSADTRGATQYSSVEGREEVGTERKPEDEDRPPEVEAISEAGGVLLRKGTLVVTPGLDYSRSSALRVAIEGFTIIPALNIGAFEITQVNRDTLTGSVSARYGLTNKLEIEARVPYVYRNDNTRSRPIGTGAGADVLSEITGDGLGDIEVGAHYQIDHNWEGWPFLIANLRFKSQTGTSPFDVTVDPNTLLQTELPTGSGFYALQPSLTAIYPSDPVVFFGNLGYIYNVGRNVGGTTGDIDPGDTISLGMGMGFSINERASFSLAYSHSMVFETTQNGATIPGSDVLQVASLSTGFAYKISDRTSVNVNVAAGLTDDSPDMTLSFRVPMTFNLFQPTQGAAAMDSGDI